MAFIELKDIEAREIAPGYWAKFVHTPTMTFAYWEIKAGSQLPEHAHVHEQVATMLAGKFELVVAGEARILAPGEIATIPSNVPHSGKAISDCRILDVFQPVREDYL